MQCPDCGHEILLDHVDRTENREDYWYTCINPRCKRHGIAFQPTGSETKSEIKTGK